MNQTIINYQEIGISNFFECLMYLSGVAIFFIFVLIIAFIKYFKLSPIYEAERDSNYYELTILLGSGGHTGQLSLLLKNLHFNKLSKLNVIITSTDKSSKIYFENLFQEEIKNQLKDKIRFFVIQRTNQVKQSYGSAIFTTLKSLFLSIKLIRNNMITSTHFLSNGPGTCVPFFFLFYVLNKLRLCKTQLIFVQSWCRVDSLSLSGKISKFFVDKYIVHWEQQKIKYPWTDYYGKIL